ncbi:multidrug effflux MFS transporter [Asanoa sp. NPDC050611]|uniref:multidrug effflux MFS transporter n=1 Tax=Asanoa sp. NPDC050611 TaxID=3157098 RepID=UPI00340A011F
MIESPVLPGELMTLRQRVRLVVVLGSLIAVGPLTIDMYLPALPALTADLETTSTAVQLTLTGTLVGLALGQLVIGPVADAYGRRRPLLAGLALHVVASALCVVAPSIAVLGVLRVIQGLGVAAATVVAMAVVRDLFSGTAFARLFSRLMLVMGLAPILAPTVGSAVLEATNWRGVFVVLGVVGVLLTLTALVALRETLPVERRRSGGVVDTVRTYGGLLTDRVFVGMVLVAGFAMAAVFSYVAGSSFVFQDQYGLDERQFGIAFGAGAVGLIAATQLNVRLLRRYTPQRVLVAALGGGTAAGALLVAFAATGFGGLATLLAALWLVLFAGGLAMPNASAVAMTRHGEAAGTAAALLGAVQFGTGAIAAPFVGVLGNDSVAMAVVVAGGMVAATSALLLVARPHRITEPEAVPAVA